MNKEKKSQVMPEAAAMRKIVGSQKTLDTQKIKQLNKCITGYVIMNGKMHTEFDIKKYNKIIKG